MFALVRTDPDAPKKQEGISFVLIDVKSPGITVRPIRTIAGDDELATVFFDDVEVPMENLVGRSTAAERRGSASTQRHIVPLHHVWRLAAEIELTALSAALAQLVALLESGQAGAEPSFTGPSRSAS
jgi:hypothetical protein